MMAPTPQKPRCGYISKTGSRCHADPQAGKEYCFFHDPEQKKKQSDARRQGGEARARQMAPPVTLPPNLPVLPLQKASDVLVLLSQTVDHFVAGEMDLRAMKAISYLTALLLRAMKAGNRHYVVELLAMAINRFRRGEMDLASAKALGYTASLISNAMQVKTMQEKQMEDVAGRQQSLQKQENEENQSAPAQAPQMEELEETLQIMQGLIQSQASENLPRST